MIYCMLIDNIELSGTNLFESLKLLTCPGHSLWAKRYFPFSYQGKMQDRFGIQKQGESLIECGVR